MVNKLLVYCSGLSDVTAPWKEHGMDRVGEILHPRGGVENNLCWRAAGGRSGMAYCASEWFNM